MLKFLSLKPDAFGMDISDFSIKIAKLKQNGNYLDLASFGDFSIKPNIIHNGEIKDEKALTKAIVDFLQEVKGEKIKTKYVVASLPEERSFLRIIKMPKMDKEELSNAIKYEAESYIPLPIDEVYFDFKIIEPMHGHKQDLSVLITAMPKKIVDAYIRVLKGAGLKPLALEVESQSAVRALIKDQVSPERVLILDMGAVRTGFDIFAGYDLRFTYSIPVCGQTFDKMIAKALKVDLKTAEKLKIKYGLIDKFEKKVRLELDKKDEKSQVLEAMIPVLVDLTEQIEKYIDYYLTHSISESLPPNGKGVEKILLCGGNAYTKGIDEFLSEELKAKAKIGNPWVNIPLSPETNERTLILKKPAKYTTALGLALRAIRGG